MTPDGQIPNIDRFPFNKVIHIHNYSDLKYRNKDETCR